MHTSSARAGSHRAGRRERRDRERSPHHYLHAGFHRLIPSAPTVVLDLPARRVLRRRHGPATFELGARSRSFGRGRGGGRRSRSPDGVGSGVAGDDAERRRRTLGWHLRAPPVSCSRRSSRGAAVTTRTANAPAIAAAISALAASQMRGLARALAGTASAVRPPRPRWRARSASRCPTRCRALVSTLARTAAARSASGPASRSTHAPTSLAVAGGRGPRSRRRTQPQSGNGPSDRGRGRERTMASSPAPASGRSPTAGRHARRRWRAPPRRSRRPGTAARPCGLPEDDAGGVVSTRFASAAPSRSARASDTPACP